MRPFKKMIERIVHVSGHEIMMNGEAAVHKAIWHATRDMDSIVFEYELTRTGDGKVFVVKGTPK